MSAQRLAAVLEALHWTACGVAQWCGYSRQAGSAWAGGRLAVPAAVARWLETRMAGELVPPPERARREA